MKRMADKNNYSVQWRKRTVLYERIDSVLWHPVAALIWTFPAAYDIEDCNENNNDEPDK